MYATTSGSQLSKSFDFDEQVKKESSSNYLRNKRVMGYRLNGIGRGGDLPVDKIKGSQRTKSTCITATEHEGLLEEILREAETQNENSKKDTKKEDPESFHSIEDLKLPAHVENYLREMGVDHIQRPQQYVPVKRASSSSSVKTRKKKHLSLRMLIHKGQQP